MCTNTKKINNYNLIKMSSDITTLVKLTTVHLYLDKTKNIIYFDVINSNYSKNDSIMVLQYFKTFWLLAQEEKTKYYLIIKINSIGVYPLNFYTNLIKCLDELTDIFKSHLHSCAFICNSSSPLIILKPLFNLYKFVRPYKLCNTYEEALIYFNHGKNQISVS